MATVEQRAGVHAALGEAIRLAIVDQLVPGDASPGELAERFGLPTNLLAHHLRVLERAGVIRRLQSEGDRRRSYVQLCMDEPTVRAAALAGTHRHANAQVPRVVFLCTANSARSQLAAAEWNRTSGVPATSAGLHPAASIHPRAVTIGQRHGLKLGRSAPRNFLDVVHPDDLVIAVCDNAYEELPSTRADLHWSIADPVPTDTDEAFEGAYQDIAHRVGQLADSMTNPS